MDMGGETESNVSGWTVDTLRQSTDSQVQGVYRHIDQQKEASEKASDLATIVQQTAMRAALEAAEKAVFTAMTAAEKAVNKAEISADKRFESMNEFRGQLADQAATLMPRTETTVLFGALENKLDSHIKTSDLERSEIRSRLDVLATQRTGATDTKADLWRAITIMVSILAIVVSIYAVVQP